MSTKTTFAAALAAITLTAAIASSPAEARGRFGTGLAVGLAAGTMVGIAASNSYYSGRYAESDVTCGYVKRFDRWGNYMGKEKVCVAN